MALRLLRGEHAPKELQQPDEGQRRVRQGDGDACGAGIEGRFAWMLCEVDWERDRDFDFVRALERDVDCAFERDHPLLVSSVAGASVVDDVEGASSVDFFDCRCSLWMTF
ncbi:hypothetical protein MRX96_012133 [Rhipicephalus microplus]